jgi:hypothetical protein
MDDDLTITSVVFGEKWIEIGFYESRDQSSDVIDLKQRLINPRLFPEDLARILDDLQGMLDQSAIHRRSPPASFRGNPE